MSQTVLNTLEKLRSMNLDQKAPTARYNPAQGGAPHAGGQRTGVALSPLSTAAAGQIADKVRACWTIDGGAEGVQSMSVHFRVTTDASGQVREVTVAPQDAGRYSSDPIFQAFVDRARRAVLDYHCSPWPLPPSLEGKVNTFNFRFSP